MRKKTPAGGEEGRLIQPVYQYCRIFPAGSNTTTGKIRRIVEVLKIIQSGSPLRRICLR